jgi:hypothetical protein
LSFKQYIPLKAAKFGIKTYELCEANSGYLWSLVVYTGKSTHFQSSLVTQEMNKSTAIVLHLVEPLLEKAIQSGWIIFTTPPLWPDCWRTKAPIVSGLWK